MEMKFAEKAIASWIGVTMIEIVHIQKSVLTKFAKYLALIIWTVIDMEWFATLPRDDLIVPHHFVIDQKNVLKTQNVWKGSVILAIILIVFQSKNVVANTQMYLFIVSEGNAQYGRLQMISQTMELFKEIDVLVVIVQFLKPVLYWREKLAVGGTELNVLKVELVDMAVSKTEIAVKELIWSVMITVTMAFASHQTHAQMSPKVDRYEKFEEMI